MICLSVMAGERYVETGERYEKQHLYRVDAGSI
jgi:hypothetical protein